MYGNPDLGYSTHTLVVLVCCLESGHTHPFSEAHLPVPDILNFTSSLNYSQIDKQSIKTSILSVLVNEVCEEMPMGHVLHFKLIKYHIYS